MDRSSETFGIRTGFDVLTEPISAVTATTSTPDKLVEVDRVLDEGLIDRVFQPIVDLHSGRLFGYEALARSRSRLLGELGELYSCAIAKGRVGELGRMHREQVLAAAPRMPLFVNIHPSEFDYPWLVRPDDPIYLHRAG